MLKQVLDRVLLKYLLLFYFTAFSLGLASGAYAKWKGIAYKSFGWTEFIGNSFLRYGSKLLFILVAIALIRYLYVKNIISKWVQILLHVCFAITLTFYNVFTQVVLSNWIYGFEDPLTWDYVSSRALLGTDYNFFLYFSLATIVYAYYFFQKQKDYELNQSSLKSQLLDAKINALQTQMQPHFLFNALNDISALVGESPEKAQDGIADLSEMLRQTLQLKDVKFIELTHELQILRKYLDIEKIRYDEKIHINIIVPEHLYAMPVPPLLFQPIVENSIKHGFSYEHDTLEVELKISSEAGSLRLSIYNNGASLKTNNQVYGVGISNLIARLDTLYSGNFTFNFANAKGRPGVETTLIIPQGDIGPNEL